MILLLFLSWFSAINCYPTHTIQEITSNPGLFYNNLGPTYVYNNYMTLISYKNVTHYEEKFTQILTIFQRSKHICDPSKHLNVDMATYCSSSMSIVESQIPKLREKFESIMHLIVQENSTVPDDNLGVLRRKRRGFINAIGTGFKWLFGTPDADDAEQYQVSIDRLFDQNRETHLLMQEQVRILNSAINSYNKSAVEFERNTEILNRNMQEIMRTNAGIAKSLHSLEETTMAIKHVTLLTQLIMQLGAEFDEIINAILFAKQNILHPSVINPKSLWKELQEVTLHSNLRLPIPPTAKDTYLYFNIMKISVALKNNNLIFLLRIPTPYKEKYNLYHMMPLPKSSNRSRIFAYISPQKPYLLIDLAATQFSLLDTLDACKSMPEFHICQTYTKSQVFAQASCEVQLKITQSKEIPKDCNINAVLANMEIWQKVSSNQWLFSLSSPQYGTVSCEESNESKGIGLWGTGILSLKPGCQLNSGGTTLRAYVTPTRNYSDFLPSIDISIDTRWTEKERALLELNLQNITWKTGNLDELSYTKRRLEAFDLDIKATLNRSYSPANQQFLLYVGIPFVIAGVLIILICVNKCLPSPRSDSIARLVEVKPA